MSIAPDKLTERDTNGTETRKSLEKQLEYQKKLNNITNRIHSASDINEILLNLQSQILGLFDADRITVYVVDGVRKEIISRFKAGNEVSEIRLPIGNGSIAGYCAASGRMASIQNVHDSEELQAIHPQLTFDKSWDDRTGYKTRQVLVAPIFYNKYLLGVLQLINKKTGARFTEEDHVAVTDIAKVLGTAFFKNQKAAQKSKPTRFDYLITNNIISSKDLSEAMSRSRKKRESVETVLITDFNVSKEDIGRSLSSFYKTRFIPYDEKMVIPGQLLKGLKIGFLRNNVFVPVEQDGNKVAVAMENPNYLPARDAVKRLIKARSFEYCVATREDIFQMIDLFFGVRETGMMGDSASIEDILG